MKKKKTQKEKEGEKRQRWSAGNHDGVGGEKR